MSDQVWPMSRAPFYSFRESNLSSGHYLCQQRLSMSSDYYLNKDSRCILIWREYPARNQERSYIREGSIFYNGLLVLGGIMINRNSQLYICGRGSITAERPVDRSYIQAMLFMDAIRANIFLMDIHAKPHLMCATDKCLDPKDIFWMNWQSILVRS